MRKILPVIQILVVITLGTLATACSNVEFGSNDGSSQKLGSPESGVTAGQEAPTSNSEEGPSGSEPSPGIIDPEVPEVEQRQIADNPGCQAIFEQETGNTDPRSGRNFHFRGNVSAAFAENADNVTASGNIQSLGVLGANHVVANRNKKHLCLVAKKISGLNGNIQSGANVVLVGEEGPLASEIGSINGNSDSKILIKDFYVQNINGNFRRLIISNSTVGHINGNIDEIHIVDGSVINRVNGNIGKYVYH